MGASAKWGSLNGSFLASVNFYKNMISVSTSLFAKNLDFRSSDSDFSDQFISDQYNKFAYFEITQLFTKLSQIFSDFGVHYDDCFGIECDNSVLNAVILLYFVREGYSFVLLPPKVSSNEHSLLPSFCRYDLKLVDRVEGSEPWKNLDHCLQIVENEFWVAPSFSLKSSLCLKTSGSTGSPKLVVHTHESLLNNARNCVQRLGIQSSDRIAIPVPIHHMYGLGAAFLPGILAGASIDLQPGANLIRYLEREREFNPNVAFMTPNFCHTLLKGRRADRQYRFTVVAGDRLQEDVLRQYESRFGSVVPLYGSTEMGAIAACSPDDSRERRSTTVGQAMPGVQLQINLDSMPVQKTCGEDMGIGEVQCQHQWGFKGYMDNQGNFINPQVGTSEGWFCTKDSGQLDGQGFLQVLGRCDDSVNRDGLLVFFAEIERLIRSIPGVEAVAVISSGETLRGKGLIAYCTVASGQLLTEQSIRMACFEHLPKRAVPDHIRIVDSLPLLSSSKIDRLALQAIAPL